MGKFKEIFVEDVQLNEKFGGQKFKWLPQRFGWFKWGIDQKLLDKGFVLTDDIIANMKRISAETQDHLSMLGVESQKSYVVVKDLDNLFNRNTGKAANTAGYATNQYIAMNN